MSAGPVSRQASLESSPQLPPQQAARLVSLDVFRGATIAGMILVNNPGIGPAYAPLQHAAWHGWTPTGLVFPFFLWIVGVALTLSFAKRLARGDGRGRIWLHVLQRSAAIFLIGLFLNGFPFFDLTTIRIPGVLQRIAVSYLVAATLFLFFRLRTQMLWTAGLLAVYWILMMYVPVPGCGAGSLTPDCNFAKWVDGQLLSGHMYRATKTWDPEGVVSTLPAIATVMFGVFAGAVLRLERAASSRTVLLLVIGAAQMITGSVLGIWMPINKMIWTVSYSLFTAGLACLIFAACYWLVDVRNWRRFSKPFAIYGMNALVVYALSGLFGRTLSLVRIGDVSLRQWLWQTFFEGLGPPSFASLLYAATHVVLFWAIAWLMHRQNWVVRV
ncbi:MAG: acyltransferase family protein [Bryobacteraceae bacterium]